MSEQQKKRNTEQDLIWYNRVPDGYSFPLPKGRYHCLWAPLSYSPGMREHFWHFPQLLKGKGNKQACDLPDLFSCFEKHKKEPLLPIYSFSFSPQKMIFPGKMFPPLLGRIEKVIPLLLENQQQKGYSHLTPQGERDQQVFKTLTGSV